MARGWAEARLENGRRGTRLFQRGDRGRPGLYARRRAFHRRRQRRISSLLQPGRRETAMEDQDRRGMELGPTQLAKLTQHADGRWRPRIRTHPAGYVVLLQDEWRGDLEA